MAIDDIVAFPGVIRIVGAAGARNAQYQCTAKTMNDAVCTYGLNNDSTKPKAVLDVSGTAFEIFPGKAVYDPAARAEEKLLKGLKRGINSFGDLFAASDETQKKYRDEDLMDHGKGLVYSAQKLLCAWMDGRVNLTETNRYTAPTRGLYR